MKLRILHISDFHYDDKHSSEYTAVVSKLTKELEREDIDLVVFSGDLAQDGKSKEVFDKAFDFLFQPILKVLKLDKSRLAITWGNHDLDRDIEKKSIKKALEDINTSKELEDFIIDERELTDSIEKFKNFNVFYKEKFNDTSEFCSLYSVQKMDIRDKAIGIVNVNSSWRCEESKKDRGNLLYPVDMLKEARSKIEGCDYLFCNQHHNISDFKEFIAWDYEDVIYDGFHFLFTGHYHKNSTKTGFVGSQGIVHSTASALSNRHDKGSKYGYTIIEFDDQTAIVRTLVYRFTDNQFVQLNPLISHFPLDEEKTKINDLRKCIRGLNKKAVTEADRLFVSGHLSKIESKYSFKKLFVEPVIKEHSQLYYQMNQKTGTKISLQDLMNSKGHCVLFGQTKSGKSSLLWKLMIDSFNNYENNRVFPYFIDYKEYERINVLSISNKLHNDLHLNKKDLKELFANSTLLLLIDNLNINDEEFKQNLVNELSEITKIKVIATSEELISDEHNKWNFNGDDAKSFFIHEIGRSEIHSLTTRWPIDQSTDIATLEKKITQLFTQMHIPFNYWTASLFLWIFQKTDENNIHNNFELVRLYIDELLHKNEVVKGYHLNVQYDDLLSYLGALAEYLLNNDYRISYQKLVNFTFNYIEQKKKFTESVEKTLKMLIDEGVLYEDENSNYTFRLKGVFEYFLAYRMTEDETLKDLIFSNQGWITSFGNEFELYAGFRKDDFGFVERLYNSIKSLLHEWTSSDTFTAIDERLTAKNFDANSLLKATKTILSILPANGERLDIEEILPTPAPIDDSHVKVKELFDNFDLNEPNIERLIYILARVYRNSHVCDHKTLGQELLDFILTGSCNLGFMFLDEEMLDADNSEMKDIVKYITRFMPLMVEAFLFDALCQNNLERVLKGKFEELLKTPNGNQFRIFLIGHMLIDLDPKKHSECIDQMTNVISKGLLRYAHYTKLIMTILNLGKNNSPRILLKTAKDLQKEFLGLNAVPFEESLEKSLRQKNIDELTKK